MSPAIQELPADLILESGKHESFEHGACVMEAVSYIAGEPWSDHPQCACPVISAFLRNWNDTLRSDEERTRLLTPLILKLIDTKSTPEVELARSMLCVDWFIRNWLPTWFDVVPALKPHAEKLRALSAIQSWSDFDRSTPLVKEAASSAAAARAAATAAATAAVRAAATDAASAAVRAAAAAVTTAAWDAVWDAAPSAARAAVRAAAVAVTTAAWNAAWAAARDALNPTVDRLQKSAVDLVERMIAVK